MFGILKHPEYGNIQFFMCDCSDEAVLSRACEPQLHPHECPDCGNEWTCEENCDVSFGFEQLCCLCVEALTDHALGLDSV